MHALILLFLFLVFSDQFGRDGAKGVGRAVGGGVCGPKGERRDVEAEWCGFGVVSFLFVLYEQVTGDRSV